MADYLALIANCPLMGELSSSVGDQRYLNLIKLRIDKFDIEIIEDPKIVTHNFSDFQGQRLHTTDLRIRDISNAQFKDAELIACELGELLSLATCSPVRKYGYDFEGERLLQAVTGQMQYFRPLIDTHRGDLVRSLLEKTWPAYRQLRDVRKLDIAFQYYVLSQQSEQPREMLLVVTFVLLENLKHNFALHQGYPYIKGYFRSYGATTSKPGKGRGFEELLVDMLQQVGMTPALGSIIQLRNELIHSGISTLDTTTQTTIYCSCQDIIREYLLRLLKYTGQYYPYSTSNKPSMI